MVSTTSCPRNGRCAAVRAKTPPTVSSARSQYTNHAHLQSGSSESIRGMRQAGRRIASVKHWHRTIFRRDDCGVPARPEQRPCRLSPCRSPACQSSFCAASRAWLALCSDLRGENPLRSAGICEATTASARLALRSANTSLFTTVGGPTRALTARHPIKLTSPRCHSAWQPQPRPPLCSIGELGYKSGARIQGVFDWKYRRTASTT